MGQAPSCCETNRSLSISLADDSNNSTPKVPLSEAVSSRLRPRQRPSHRNEQLGATPLVTCEEKLLPVDEKPP